MNLDFVIKNLLINMLWRIKNVNLYYNTINMEFWNWYEKLIIDDGARFTLEFKDFLNIF